MLEHEGESDEDCEVYFLKPVNEYNIVDKIKEANKELFALESANETDATMSRKVTFALNLEDYEPGGPRTVNSEAPPDGIELKLEADFKFPPIDEEIDELTGEEPQTEEVQLRESSAANEDIATTSSKLSKYFSEKVTTPLEDDGRNATEVNAEVVEEICEEIIVMDMDSQAERQPKSGENHNNRSRMIKEATFDYDEEDSKSLTNLLTSDFEEEDGEETENGGEINNDDEERAVEEGEQEEEEDDDDLSIIVASYIPDTFDKDSLLSEKDDRKAKSKRVPFRKRFSFRRKTGTSNTVGSASFASSSRGSARHLPPPEVTELKFNYKTCCEYRNAVQEKLPKYTGYLSEYGLTSEQIEKREDKLKKKKRYVLEQALRVNEQEMRKMQDNERAFTTWLKQKMRFPINKTRNMFDVKFPTCGGSSAVRNRINSGKIK